MLARNQGSATMNPPGVAGHAGGTVYCLGVVLPKGSEAAQNQDVAGAEASGNKDIGMKGSERAAA